MDLCCSPIWKSNKIILNWQFQLSGGEGKSLPIWRFVCLSSLPTFPSRFFCLSSFQTFFPLNTSVLSLTGPAKRRESELYCQLLKSPLMLFMFGPENTISSPPEIVLVIWKPSVFSSSNFEICAPFNLAFLLQFSSIMSPNEHFNQLWPYKV